MRIAGGGGGEVLRYHCFCRRFAGITIFGRFRIGGGFGGIGSRLGRFGRRLIRFRCRSRRRLGIPCRSFLALGHLHLEEILLDDQHPQNLLVELTVTADRSDGSGIGSEVGKEINPSLDSLDWISQALFRPPFRIFDGCAIVFDHGTNLYLDLAPFGCCFGGSNEE